MIRSHFATRSAFAIVTLASVVGCADLQAGDDGLGATNDEVAANRVLIHFDPHQRIQYGYDIKQDGRPQSLNATLAQEIFGQDQFDLIRIPIFARRGHPSAEHVSADAYDNVINAVQRAQSVRPDVKVFASLRLDENGTFPGWVMQSGHVQPDDYAHLMMDFLQYMQAHGITVDYLGPDNESVFNGGELTPARFADAVHSLAQRCHDHSLRMPQIVGDDNYSPDLANSWIDGLQANGQMQLLDVAGVHYYSKHRTPGYHHSLAQWAHNAGARPTWDTEFHWNDDTGGGDFHDAKLGIMTAFDNMDEGIQDITWWAYNPRSNHSLTASLQSALVQATVHGRPLTTADPDGAALDEHKFNSRAFSQGNDVTLVVVNDTDHDENNRRVDLEGMHFDHAVTYQRWSAGSVDGVGGTADRYPQNGVFTVDFPAQTITVVRVPNVQPGR